MKLIDRAIDAMLELYNKGEFVPLQEADVQCLMYHLIIKLGTCPVVHANFPFRLQEKLIHLDLVVGEGSENDIRGCVAIEMKFISRSWGRNRILKRIDSSVKDLERLSQIQCDEKCFLFLNEADPLSAETKDNILAARRLGTRLTMLEKKNNALERVFIE